MAGGDLLTAVPPDPALPASLRRRIALARAALFWERLWPLAWPVLGVLGLFLLVALLGLPLLLPLWLHLLLLLGFLLALGFVALRSWRGFALPDEGAAARRLEDRSGLRHRPLATLTDRPATDDPFALALWQVHRDRAAAQLRRLRVGLPAPRLPAHDPRALRAGLLLSLVAALFLAGGSAPERIRRALLPSFGSSAPIAATRLEAWVTPPAYTGTAPVLLDAAGGAVTVPTGSKLQVSVSGGMGGAPELLLDRATTPFRALDHGSFTAEAVLQRGGRLAVRRDGAELAGWPLTVQGDQPPSIAFAEPPGRARTGHALRLPWRAEDDWGLAALRAELLLQRPNYPDGRPRPAPEKLPLPLPLPDAAPKQAHGAAQPDLSAHPWAGLPVAVQLVARDGAGQEGRSETVTVTLPEREFHHPVAQALIALRKALSVDPEEREAARGTLDRIAAAPDDFENDTATFLALRAARAQLRYDRRPQAVDEVQALLWDTALALEEGRADRTGRALAEARQAVRQALQQPPGATPEERAAQQAELQRRIEALREAVRQHMQALAERLRQQNAEPQAPDAQSRALDQREIDRRAQRLEQAAREGRREDAQRELAELEQMLQALQEGRVARMQNSQRQAQQQRGRQQMGALQDMVRRQGEMLDHAQGRADAEARRDAEEQRRLPFPGFNQRFRPESPNGVPNPGQDQADPGQPGPPSPGAQSPGAQSPGSQSPAPGQDAQRSGPSSPQGGAQRDARIQGALRRALGELMQQYGDLTGEVPEGLGRADQAMQQAQEALGRNADPRAAQNRAIEALQEGGRQMASRMQQQFGMSQQGDDGEGEGEGEADGDQPGGGNGRDQARERGEGRDPLGRHGQDSAGTADAGADTRVPEEAEQLRTRALQQELRRRGAERERPTEELDYIDRLLKQF